MSSATGKLIVIEGMEGAGKSTAIQTLTDFLMQHQISTITTREPGGTAIGEQLRSIIKNTEYKDSLDDRGELLLFYTARMQLLKEVIKPALAQGTWVVADRFELSTLAYQGGGRGLDLELIKTISAFCLNGFKPDFTLFLDIKPELGMQRASLRGQFDRIEQQSLPFFERVYQTYMNLIKNDPQSVIIDASQSIPEVQKAIIAAMSHFIEQHS